MKAHYSLPQDLTNLTLISFLDMSRWMAAAIVFISHLRNPLFLGYGDVLAQDKNILVQGWYFVTGWFPEGVIVFFVLSGLLVGGSGVAKVQSKAFTLKNYSIDRFSRLYVALVPALILCIILDKIGINFFAEIGYWDHTHPMIAQKIASEPFEEKLSFITAMSNLMMLQYFFVETLGSNGPLWTISSEFWFYFIFGVFTLFSSKNNTVRNIALVISAITLYLLGIKFLILLGYWLLGLFAGIISKRISLSPLFSSIIFLLTLVLSRFFLSDESSLLLVIVKNYLVALSFAVLIVSMRGRNITFFEKTHAFNKFFADFSYSLYLIHFPLMLFFLALISSLGSFPGIATGYSPTSIEGLGLYGLVIFLVYISSYAFSLLTERKTYQVKVKIRNVWEKF